MTSVSHSGLDMWLIICNILAFIIFAENKRISDFSNGSNEHNQELNVDEIKLNSFEVSNSVLSMLEKKVSIYGKSNLDYLNSLRVWKNQSNRFFENDKKHRKRSIIYDGGGVVKLILGVTYPIKLSIKSGSLFYFYNIQLQYMPPPEPIYWWSFYNSTTFAARQERNNLYLSYDRSRELVYSVIEDIFERYQLPGLACLLRTICEVSSVEFMAVNANTYKVLHDLLNAIFLPKKLNVNERYYNAYLAGRSGINCLDLFSDCPGNNDWLDKTTIKL